MQTPSNVNEKLTAKDGTRHTDATRFWSLVGGLMYLTHRRPNISHSVGIISRFMQTPTKQYMSAARRILMYAIGTMSYGLWYKSVENPSLIGYSDSDWAGRLEDRKSTSGQVFFYGDNAIKLEFKEAINRYAFYSRGRVQCNDFGRVSRSLAKAFARRVRLQARRSNYNLMRRSINDCNE